jgi:hypothetical protein
MNKLTIDCSSNNFQMNVDLKHNLFFLNLRSFNNNTIEILIKLWGWLRDNQKND